MATATAAISAIPAKEKTSIPKPKNQYGNGEEPQNSAKIQVKPVITNRQGNPTPNNKYITKEVPNLIHFHFPVSPSVIKYILF